MVTTNEIGWGSYGMYEGPFFKGNPSARYVLPAAPARSARIMAVITSTEGGNYAAINMYDRGIISSGLIQWIESSQYSVSDMLGKVAEHSRDLLERVERTAHDAGLEFKKNAKGRWRFFFHDARGEVDREQEQQQMFFLTSNGKKGTWGSGAKAYAKEWAAAVSSVWENPIAQKIQLDYTTARLMGFCLPYAKNVLQEASAGPYGELLTAAYLSFAANNPTWACQALQEAVKVKGAKVNTFDGIVDILEQLTFYKKITIYPHRYNAIRPVLEKLYSVDLPDFAKQLGAFSADLETRVWSTVEVQKSLIALGYDLGPWGADGKWGAKTTAALLAFETTKYEGVKTEVPVGEADGRMDAYTAKKLEAVLTRVAPEVLNSLD